MVDQLIEKYYSRVYAFALVHAISEDIARDLTQDVFLQLVKKEKDLQNIDDIEAYIFTIARNKTYKYFKKINNSNLLKEKIMKSYSDQYIDIEKHILAGDLEDKLNEFVHQLPYRQREIYKLSREQGLSYKEIAEQLEISPNTVRNHLAQALKTLRGKYEILGCIFFIAFL